MNATNLFDVANWFVVANLFDAGNLFDASSLSTHQSDYSAWLDVNAILPKLLEDRDQVVQAERYEDEWQDHGVADKGRVEVVKDQIRESWVGINELLEAGENFKFGADGQGRIAVHTLQCAVEQAGL